MVQPGIEATELFALIYMGDSPAEFARPIDSDIWRRYTAIALNGIRAESSPPQPLTVNALGLAEVEQAEAANPARCRSGAADPHVSILRAFSPSAALFP
ncbi:hypothetical protein [Nocardia rhamnosiphila]|uniref:Uncharacterized protein n=1 Tax=Nocardia rhamnosiphila TaxID=426716 RepID=A0ABV2WVY8_9NOCA